jgi:hypothetical protein
MILEHNQLRYMTIIVCKLWSIKDRPRENIIFIAVGRVSVLLLGQVASVFGTESPIPALLILPPPWSFFRPLL